MLKLLASKPYGAWNLRFCGLICPYILANLPDKSGDGCKAFPDRDTCPVWGPLNSPNGRKLAQKVKAGHV